MKQRYFDDFKVRDRFKSEPLRVTEEKLIDFARKESASDLVANAVSPSSIGVGPPNQVAFWRSPRVPDAVQIGRLKPESGSNVTRID